MSRIPRIFVDQALAPGSELRPGARARRHLVKVLRLRDGAPLKVFDGHGKEHEASLLSRGEATILRVGEALPTVAEPRLRICLVQGISRGERMDIVVQKATELGVSEIRPVTTKRSVVRLDERRARSRLEHWRAVAISACEQCGRATLPSIHPPADYEAALRDLPTEHTRLMLEASTPAGPPSPPERALTLLVGPEGGLSEEEKQAARASGFQSLSLGPRVLRTETAALAGLAVAQFLWGDLRHEA